MHSSDRLQEAEGAYGETVVLDPYHHNAHNNLAIIYKKYGNLSRAERSYRLAIIIKPDYASASYNLAILFQAGNRIEEAVRCYRKTIRLIPDSAEARNNLGLALHSLNLLVEASDFHKSAIILNPQSAEAWNNSGITSNSKKDTVICCSRVVKLSPNSANAHHSLGMALQAENLLEESIISYKNAIRLSPLVSKIYLHLGNALTLNGHSKEGAKILRTAISLDPSDEESWNILSILQHELGRLNDAEKTANRGITLAPHIPESHANLAVTLLSKGDFKRGWEEYEWRQKTRQLRDDRRNFPIPLWKNEDGYGRRVLIHAEQGLGDTLQFCRYATLVAARGWKVWLTVPPPLYRLMKSLKGIDHIVNPGDPAPSFDAHCPMMSLPLAFGTDINTIPAEQSYLAPSPQDQSAWQKKLEGIGGNGLKVGIVWAVDTTATNRHMDAIDKRRFIPSELIAPLLTCPGVHFFNLQKSDPEKKSPLPPFSKGGGFVSASSSTFEKGGTQISPPFGKGGRGGFLAPNLIDFMDQMNDFADTAALIANLDLVISVDTAVAHLAGALGKPVWLLNRFDSCWRWFQEREDSPWYSSLRIFRQKEPGNWQEVIERVRQNLEKFSRSPRSDKLSDKLLYDAAFCYGKGDFDEAKALCQKIIEIDPNHGDSLNILGAIACKTGSHEQGIKLIRAALKIIPFNASCHSNLCNALMESHQGKGELQEAIISGRKALILEPDHSSAMNNLYLAANMSGQYDEAISIVRRISRIVPLNASYHLHLCSLLMNSRQDSSILQETIASGRKALIIKPDHSDAMNNLSIVMDISGQYDEAISIARRALKANPGHALAHNSLGIMLQKNMQNDLARKSYDTALILRPELASTHFNRATLLLGEGVFREGWREYEWRWETGTLTKRDINRPQWHGEDGDGRTILIHAEQGLGDSLQFCRLIPMVAARGWRVILEVPSALLRLAKTLAGVDVVITDAETISSFDVHCPMLSLPLILAIDLSNIPTEIPYLHPDPKAVANWREFLDQKYGTNLRVGIVWAGNPRINHYMLNATDRRRSIEAELLAPLLENKDIRFFSLQKNDSERKSPLPPFSKGGRGGFFATNLIDFMDQMDDLADTAALVASLDLIISVDTSMVHLAGALGKQVWLLNRFDACWRWLQEREDSPWYPSLRIFRQKEPGNWHDVIAMVSRELNNKLYSPHSERWQAKPDGVVAGAEQALKSVSSLRQVLPPHPLRATPPKERNLRRTSVPSKKKLKNYFKEAALSHGAGEYDRSDAICRKILVWEPSHADSLHLSGVTACLKQNKAIGVCMIARAIRANYSDSSYHSNIYFNVLFELGQITEAMQSASASVSACPDSSDFHCNLAIALNELGQTEKVESSYIKAIILKPDNTCALSNLGNFFKSDGDIEQAVACYSKSLNILPINETPRNNMGLCLHGQERLGPAERYFLEAIVIHPGYALAYNNLGNLLQEQRKTDLSGKLYNRAIELQPDFARAHTNYAMFLLGKGLFLDGWKEYEWRWKTDMLVDDYSGSSQMQWRGEKGNGRTILIHAEQGFGDSLQFCRLIPMVAARGWRILLEVPSPLARLLQTIDGVDFVFTHGETRPAFDVHCSMLSLPLALDLDASTIPTIIPYLHPPKEAVDQWRKLLETKYGDVLRIGIAWSGHPKHSRRRSIMPELLAPLFENKDVCFFSLQKNDPEIKSPLPPFFKGGDFVSASYPHFEKGGTLISPPFEKGGRGGFSAPNLIDFMDQMNDFADTAALVANLDLIISVDASTVHLAGALGKPVWMFDRFSPCWRWLEGREDSPWYPSLRIFRQKEPGEWPEVIERVRQNLEFFSRPSDSKHQIADFLNQAIYFYEGGDFYEAKALCRKILEEIDPDHGDSLHILGTIACRTGDHEQGINLIRDAIKIIPFNASCHSNLCKALVEFHTHKSHLQEAIISGRKALILGPEHGDAMNNLAIAIGISGQHDKAMSIIRRAHKTYPANINIREHLAFALIIREHYAEGWQEMECRLQKPEYRQRPEIFAKPQWKGEEGRNRILLIHAEQGFGDSLQFCRCVHLVTKRGWRVILAVPVALVKIMKSLSGIHQVIAENAPLPAFDAHCSMLSLPLALSIDLSHNPTPIPYLFPDPEDIKKWEKAIAMVSSQKCNIGIVWAGNPRFNDHPLHTIDRRRSIRPELLAPLFENKNICFFSLQKNDPARKSPLPPFSKGGGAFSFGIFPPFEKGG